MPPPPDVADLGPFAAGEILRARNAELSPANAGAGGLDPADINNKAIFALFGVIGAAFVCVGIWFFFWAKNGGFYFEEADWDDYKTTVMRRKGPNGTLLSGATESTKLGGGSIYKDVAEVRRRGSGGRGRRADDAQTEYTEGYEETKYGDDDDARTAVSGLTGITGITPGASDLGGRERHMARKEKREQRKREKIFEKQRKQAKKNTPSNLKGVRHVGEDGVLVDKEATQEAEEYLREYRHEKPARVGGMNVESEASVWDDSTNAGDSVLSSELLGNRQGTPTRESPAPASGRKLHKKKGRESPSKEKTPAYPYNNSQPGTPSRASRRYIPTEMTSEMSEVTTAFSGSSRQEPSAVVLAPASPADVMPPSPTKRNQRAAGGIRQVYSVSVPDHGNHREQERIKAEARKLQEKGRQATASAAASSAAGPSSGRRDFSWQRNDVPDNSYISSSSALRQPEAAAGGMAPVMEESRSMLGAESRVHWEDEEDENESHLGEGSSMVGTKSYHHPIPELTGSSAAGSEVGGGSSVAGSYVDERRRQRRAERSAVAGSRSDGYRREKRRT